MTPTDSHSSCVVAIALRNQAGECLLREVAGSCRSLHGANRNDHSVASVIVFGRAVGEQGHRLLSRRTSQHFKGRGSRDGLRHAAYLNASAARGSCFDAGRGRHRCLCQSRGRKSCESLTCIGDSLCRAPLPNAREKDRRLGAACSGASLQRTCWPAPVPNAWHCSPRSRRDRTLQVAKGRNRSRLLTALAFHELGILARQELIEVEVLHPAAVLPLLESGGQSVGVGFALLEQAQAGLDHLAGGAVAAAGHHLLDEGEEKSLQVEGGVFGHGRASSSQATYHATLLRPTRAHSEVNQEAHP